MTTVDLGDERVDPRYVLFPIDRTGRRKIRLPDGACLFLRLLDDETYERTTKRCGSVIAGLLCLDVGIAHEYGPLDAIFREVVISPSWHRAVIDFLWSREIVVALTDDWDNIFDNDGHELLRPTRSGLYALMSDARIFEQVSLAVGEDLRFYKSRQGKRHV